LALAFFYNARHAVAILFNTTNPLTMTLVPTGWDWGVVATFVLVYLGMFLGGLPTLKLDRAGVALLGAIAMIGMGAVTVEQAARSIDLPTILLLFSFMVMSAQMRLGGFYAAVTQGVGGLPWPPSLVLGALVAAAAALSAVFSNDVICLAMTPLVARLCLARGWPPLPFLVGLACAANIGSAATLIGNPQNMLIGSVLHLNFAGYFRQAVVPVVLSVWVLWLWLVKGPGSRAVASAGRAPALAVPVAQRVAAAVSTHEPPLDRVQTAKGLVVATAVLAAFLFTTWPHDVVALVAAGVLLLSRRFHSSQVMGFVDWELLILFMGLFVVNHAFEQTGLAAQAVAALAAQGIHLGDTGALMAATLVLSNLVSNVPAVMLLLPHVAGQDPVAAGLALALVSTLAGNLLLVGSIANLIVADLAQQQGIAISWRDHARIGAPVTLLTLGVVAGWLRWGL
jgi:Na+/H+ antiporter NhaD/arsenite permease-like protein